MVKVLGAETGRCDECSIHDGFCQTCVFSPSQCLSCLVGYELDGMKCISKVRVKMIILLDTTMSEFIPKINTFKRDFVQSLGPPYSNNPHWVSFFIIEEGSLNVTATLTIPQNTS